MRARLDEVPEANTLLLGIAPPGGKIPPSWRAIILDTIARRKMDVISGLHDFVGDDPEFSAAAKASGVPGLAAMRPAPPLGGDSRAVLIELGFATSEIDTMAKDGVI